MDKDSLPPTLVEAFKIAEEFRSANRVAREEVLGFFPDALRFSTWYLAVHDRRGQAALDYLEEGNGIAQILGRVICFPSQTLFAHACDVAESFLNGYVSPEKVQELGLEGTQAAEDIGKSRAVISKSFDCSASNDAQDMPKIITDSFYPLSLAGIIGEHINKDGLVTLRPETRKFLNALIFGEGSLLRRLDGPSPP